MISKRTLLPVIILIGSTLFLAAIFYFFPINSIKGDPILSTESVNILKIPGQAKKGEFIVGLPMHIKIPKINVDADVEYVGITDKGEVGVPNGPANVAWFGLGPRPGENGSAVIVGHYGWKNNISAVFDELYKLKSGDKIYIEDDRGVTISFLVRETRRYDPDANALNVFVSNDDNSHLNLITCEGTWNKDLQSYSKRLVVFADKLAE